MTAAVFTDTVTRAGVTATRSWSADPATDPFAYLVDQRCDGCGAQVSDDDRGPLYDTATDDGTAHRCPDEVAYAAVADEMNDGSPDDLTLDDLDPESVALAETYARRAGLSWPPAVGDFDRYYERKTR